MTTSILNSVKKVLGMAEDYTAFDQDVIMHINSVFSTLNQLGIGPDKGYAIEDATATWEDYLGADLNLNSVKSYMYLKVRSLFDPPTTSFLLDSMAKQIQEMEWRLNVYREGYAWADPMVGPIGRAFEVIGGLPLHERFRIVDGKNLWDSLDTFKVTFLLTATQDPTSATLSNLAPYVAASFDNNDILLDWSMTPNQTKLLRSGYYKLDLSDVGNDPVKLIRISSGQFKVTF